MKSIVFETISGSVFRKTSDVRSVESAARIASAKSSAARSSRGKSSAEESAIETYTITWLEALRRWKKSPIRSPATSSGRNLLMSSTKCTRPTATTIKAITAQSETLNDVRCRSK